MSELFLYPSQFQTQKDLMKIYNKQLNIAVCRYKIHFLKVVFVIITTFMSFHSYLPLLSSAFVNAKSRNNLFSVTLLR